MILSLDEMKGYLRVDFNDDDQLIEHLIAASENLCADIARLSVAELTISLRSLLEGVRRSVF